MQRMISHAAPLPPCRAGHSARHIHDGRRASAGGGHLVECACTATAKHAEFDAALGEWCRTHGHKVPNLQPPCQLPLATVTRLRVQR